MLPSDDRYLREADNRLWGNLNYRDAHQVYVRLQLRHRNFSAGDQFTGSNDKNELNLDQGYYALNFDRALDWRTSSDGLHDMELTAGRQNFHLGSGLVYNRDHDGFKLGGNYGNFRVTGLGARSDPEEFNVDKSVPDFEESERYFFGGEVSYDGFSRFSPYLFALDQRDSSDHGGTSINFDYDSQYYGIGFSSEPLKNLSFSTEYVLQNGTSTARNPITLQETREDIDAWALKTGLEYFWNRNGKPKLLFEYMRGSGDRDRLSVTDTIGGNDPGTDDKNFLYFGYTYTGLSLNPRLSNLSIWRLGGSVEPWNNPSDRYSVPWKNLQVGMDLFYYRKIKEDGGISDRRAVNSEEEVGWEVDLKTNWRVFSDTLVQARYGLFFQGDAYNGSDTQDFFSLHLTVSY